MKSQRVQYIANIFSCIKNIKKILKQHKIYKDLFSKNLLTTKEVNGYIKDLIILNKELKRYLKDTKVVFTY